ncbi:helix-turn-helix domain-containing protein [Leuconostoc suionicum]|uniref:helix-turn-helix domain-containing protein n=1 Tax=Leuconostoc suionicum TaxID=1511761 RepID=UPI0039EA2A58
MLADTLKAIQQLITDKIFMQDTHNNVIFGDENLFNQFNNQLNFHNALLENPSSILFYQIVHSDSVHYDGIFAIFSIKTYHLFLYGKPTQSESNSSTYLLLNLYQKYRAILAIIYNEIPESNGTINIKSPDDSVSLLEYSSRLQTHHSYLDEQALLSTIKTGDKQIVINAYKQFQVKNEHESFLAMKNNRLRHEKNMLIIVATLATREAIQAGVNEKKAYLLSDQWINTIEKHTTVEDIINQNVRLNILLNFASLVKSLKYSKLSHLIFEIQTYIQIHIYENLSIIDIAKQFKYSQNYLSARFKKETNQTLKQYIIGAKIEEAKRLLLSTQLSLIDISTLLNFKDYTHFSHTFKRLTGTSPKQFISTKKY